MPTVTLAEKSGPSTRTSSRINSTRSSAVVRADWLSIPLRMTTNSSPPRRPCRWSDPLVKCLGHPDDHLVTDGMAVGVVHELEVVDVDDENGDALSIDLLATVT